jgi:peptidoglycan/xylan/chitin deacetylase (PgdA/CDA1 family)
VWKQIFPKDVITLCYHVVSDEDVPHIKYFRYKSVRQFEDDIAYIQAQHRFISYDELVRQRLRNASLPPNGFFSTFDDGLAECFTVIRPTLLKHNVRCAFFVTTNFIDNQKMFFEHTVSLCIGAVEKLGADQAAEFVQTLAVDQLLNDSQRREAFNISLARFRWARIQPLSSESHRSLIILLLMLQQNDEELIDKFCEFLGLDQAAYLQNRPLYLTAAQIRQAFAEGFTIGAHGTAHKKLRLLSSPQLIESEIVTSCDIIRQITGQKKVPFAFPYTGNGLENAFLADLLRRYEFIELFFDLQGLYRSPPFIVNRLWADLPLGSDKDKANLAYQLRQAWSQAEVWSRRR